MSSGTDVEEFMPPMNGLIWNEIYCPEEVTSLILSYVETETILTCRLVCRIWRNTIDCISLKRKAMICSTFSHLPPSSTYPLYVYYAICKFDPFNRNLLKNHCGQDGFDNWTITRGIPDGGSHANWIIEPVPIGSDNLPQLDDFVKGLSCCFVTSYNECSKEQKITLSDFGLSDKIMDRGRPTIVASEWYAGRFDCGCIYKLRISLLREDDSVIRRKNLQREIRQWQGRAWHKVELVFSNLPRGVRKILFDHGGKDTSFWAGHYGCKISGATLKVLLPPHFLNDDEDDAKQIEEQLEAQNNEP